MDVCFIGIWNVDMFPKWGRGYAKRLNGKVMGNCMNMQMYDMIVENQLGEETHGRTAEPINL